MQGPIKDNEPAAEFQRLVASVRDYAIFMLDPEGYVRTWNAGARHVKGYAPDEIIGRHFSTFYTAFDRERDHPAHELEIAVREGRYEEEGWRVRKDGTRFWASVTITAVHDDDGVLTGFAKVTRDLTERKRAQDALEAAVEELREANAELDRFAAVAAHDMTDPLRTITGFAEILVEEDLPPDEAKQFAQYVLDSSERLSGMLQGLLTYARAGQAVDQSAPVVVAELAAQVIADLAQLVTERRAEVRCDAPREAVVPADRHGLRLVLQNLVSNAIKFGDPAGPVVTIAAERDDAGWRVSVSDNGPGITPRDRERIFDAFNRGAGRDGHSGYGLGLAICTRILERHGARLELDSELGHGSRFWFTLPAGDLPDAAVPV